jgi:hypothetical protein
MANGFLPTNASIGAIPPELFAQQQALNRQQQMAQLLMQQGMNQPQGQMVSGRYVAPSFFQYAAPLAQLYAGTRLQEKGDKTMLELAEALRKRQENATQDLTNTMFGAPAQYVSQGEPLAGEMISPAIKASPQDAFKKAMLYADVPQIRAMLPTLAEQVIPKPITPTGEIANYTYMKEKGLIPANMTALQYQAFLKQIDNKPEKAPAGYRFTSDGSLEPIKGGPADLKSQQKFAGQENVDTLIGGLRDQYNVLLANEGITSKEAGTIPNLRSAISRSAVGQTVGQAVGSTNQSARNTIAQSRPLLLNAIKEATGMSAKQMDSNAELKMYLAAATDPTLDYESNMYALNQLETLFGTPSANRQSGANVPSTNAPSAPQTNVPQAKNAQVGQPLYATNPNTKQRIVSTDGGITWKPVQGK